VTGMANAEADPMYDQAVEVVLKHRRASISLVQRHLRIGYNRAARLLEQMEIPVWFRRCSLMEIAKFSPLTFLVRSNANASAL